MGTRFLLTSDSTVPDAVKQRYLDVAWTAPWSRHGSMACPPRLAHGPGGEAGERVEVRGFAAAIAKRRQI